MIDLDGISIARSPAFGREAYKILWYLTARLEFDDFSVLNIGEISADLGLKSQAVSRALRTLIDGGVVERGPRSGLRNSFRFRRPGTAGNAADLPQRPRRVGPKGQFPNPVAPGYRPASAG